MNPTSSSLLPVPAVSWSGYLEALGLVCFLLAFLWALLWLVKKRGGGVSVGNSLTMRIESRLALGPKKWILITRVQDTRLVLGVTDQQITLLTELPVEPSPERPAAKNGTGAKGANFAALLGRQRTEAGNQPSPAAPPAGQPAGAGD